MFVCMYRCMRVCMCVCMYRCMYVYMCVYCTSNAPKYVKLMEMKKTIICLNRRPEWREYSFGKCTELLLPPSSTIKYLCLKLKCKRPSEQSTCTHLRYQQLRLRYSEKKMLIICFIRYTYEL